MTLMEPLKLAAPAVATCSAVSASFAFDIIALFPLFFAADSATTFVDSTATVTATVFVLLLANQKTLGRSVVLKCTFDIKN